MFEIDVAAPHLSLTLPLYLRLPKCLSVSSHRLCQQGHLLDEGVELLWRGHRMRGQGADPY